MHSKTINKMKRQPSEWEKIFANEATDKGLISKIYKQLMKLNIRKHTNLDFPGGAVVKNLPANTRDMGLSPGPGRSHMPWNN